MEKPKNRMKMAVIKPSLRNEKEGVLLNQKKVNFLVNERIKMHGGGEM